jgi:tRNA modification GTPase
MFHPNDTIAAPATPPGESALAVVRISGPQAWDVFRSLIEAVTPPPLPRLMTRGHLRDASGPLDEVLYCFYASPASYTGEDMVEIFCHGSPLLSGRILQALYDAGARPAAPGEFTQRAYLNGKMDLVQAESVAELIRARSDDARRAALRHLSGELSHTFQGLREELLQILGLVEANIDFSAEDIDLLQAEKLQPRLEAIAARLRTLDASYRTGRVMFDGLRVAVVGQPNAGKSSLLNAILGREEIIVDHRPGTTRDFIEKEWEFQGFRLIFTDTAGLRETADPVEKIGVRKTGEIIQQAHAVLYLADASLPPDPSDEKNFSGIQTVEKIFCYSKADRPVHPGIRKAAPDKNRPLVSIQQPETLNALLHRILAPWRQADRGQEVLASERQAVAAGAAAHAVETIIRALREPQPAEEIIALELRHALEALSAVTGRVTDDDVLREIFGKFCIGK